jgi:hypothetical protein
MQNHYIKDQCFLWNMFFLVGVECLLNCITKNGNWYIQRKKDGLQKYT